MVASEKDLARHRFAKLFNEELTRAGIPIGRGRIAETWRRLKSKGKPLVSQQQVRKWLKGVDIPDQANLRIVCERLRIDWVKLASPKQSQSQDATIARVVEIMEDMEPPVRAEVLNFAEFRLGQLTEDGETDMKAAGT